LWNAEEALDAAFDAGGDSGFLQFVAEQVLDARHKKFAGFAACFHGGVDLLEGNRIHVAEAEVFELAANLAHAQAVRDGRVDVERLSRDFLLAVGRQVFQGPHVVQPVGQLDHDDPDVVDHRQHHFFAGSRLGLLLWKKSRSC